jgi:hypothetical protein|tara:strand:+ start:49 stop:774 length:726 start_codon:yes stop_codon:yes gene_type:complete
MRLINKVYETTDYDLFKFIHGNRNINLSQLNKLKESIAEDYIQVPIIVNEKYEIIDGQHRYHVLQSLKKPIYFIKVDGLGMPEVHRLNTINKNWTLDDYMNSYCNKKLPEYIQYRDFKNRYRFNHNECIILLKGYNGHIGSTNLDEFKQGKFKIKSLEYAEHNAQIILSYEKYYDGVRRRSFVLAILDCLKILNFKHKTLLTKMSYQSAKILHQTCKEDYLRSIEKIYNFNNKKKKIRLNY